MIALQDILYRVPLLEVVGDRTRPVRAVQFDSRRVEAGDLFVAVSGTQHDGHRFIQAAIQAGATHVVCEILPGELQPAVTYLRVKDSTLALAHLAANYYGNPADQLTIIGVTGTNGKTTVASLLYYLLMRLGYPAALLSTVAVRVGTQVLEATHTTPDPLQLHAHFRRFVDAGCQYVCMEVSSHALHQKRVAGVAFAGAIFTNLTHDHLDYHGTFENYRDAKKLLFDQLPNTSWALTNIDDRNGAFMLQNCDARQCTYSLRTVANYHTRLLDGNLTGLHLTFNDREVFCRLLGEFNAYNLTAVMGAALELGLDLDEVLLAASNLQPPPGRLQVVPLGEVTAVVDYAHTPDAVRSVLRTLRDLREQDTDVITVIGCGGDRDRTKRPEMARIATDLSSLVILTSDNPRSEDPQAILDEMYAGVPISYQRKVIRQVDRREAIRLAVRMAQPGSVILVAGKGHETYQEIAGVKHPFSDAEELEAAYHQLQL
jgi:UDP-N-acetylmuramoyl-L-alanyl-D-glutamate--2,6-diaminopimelate ligase